MKRVFLLLLLVIGAVCGYAQQTVTVAFTGLNGENQSYVRLDSVKIVNLTRNWEEMLYYPDTILIMNTTVGIEENRADYSFQLFQNQPNPFSGETELVLQLQESETIHLAIYNVNGQRVADYNGILSAGQHRFAVTLSTPQTYFASLTTAAGTSTIKMINQGNGGACSLNYVGSEERQAVTLRSNKGAIDNAFDIGDLMQYTGYTTNMGQVYVSESITQSQIASELLTLSFSGLLPTDFTVNGVTFTMKPVQGGTFYMGAQSTDSGGQNYDDEATNNENPVHQVTVSSFYMGEFEVTQALWRAVMGTNPSYFSGDNLPVEQVSWNDIQNFITQLNVLTGRTFRLPTEAEWEFAARGGNQSHGYKYSGGDITDNVVWYTSNSNSQTQVVGGKQANELGLYDMSGNVWEWCQDWFGSYESSAQTNPQGISSGSYRVLRGGSWRSYAWDCRVSIRDADTPDTRSYDSGFRLVLVQ